MLSNFLTKNENEMKKFDKNYYFKIAKNLNFDNHFFHK